MAKKKVSIKEVTNKYSLFLFALLIFSVISLLWIKDFSGWLIYSAVLFTGMVNSFVLWLLISNKKIKNHLMKIILLAILLQNIAGWFEVTTGIYPFAFNIETNHIAYNQLLRRPITFFKNVNDYATYLLFGYIFLLSYKPKKNIFSKIPYQLKQILKSLLALSTLGLIFMVGSRGILLVSILSTVLLLLLKINNRMLSKLAVVLGIGLMVTIIIGLLINYGFINIDALDAGDSARVYLIMNGLKYLTNTVFIGVGPGNVSYYLENYRYFPVGHLRTIHSWWIEFLVMYGLVFFVFYISMYARNILKSYKQFKLTKNNLFIFTTTWSIAFTIASVVSSSLHTTLWVIFMHNAMFITVDKNFHLKS
ncbi:O-antigen ligase family protein [Atopostipes suicloacalis]|nr:O-antigen ligase family protein [Atopostipes suicloacalis]